jgi:hypothetical protein
VSELARIFESKGLTTTGVVLLKEHAAKVKPPRMLAVPFNFGNTLGEANNPEIQHEILDSTFELLKYPKGPVLEDFTTGPVSDPIVQASQVNNSSKNNGINPREEIINSINNYEKWLETNNGRSAVGLSGVHYSNFSDIVDFMIGFAGGDVRDNSNRPPDVSLARFLRYCVDDLKAFSFESKMATKAHLSINELHEWFWTKTAIANLFMDLKKSMDLDLDPDIRTEAIGIAR